MKKPARLWHGQTLAWAPPADIRWLHLSSRTRHAYPQKLWISLWNDWDQTRRMMIFPVADQFGEFLTVI
jgi:hypothetical protein